VVPAAVAVLVARAPALVVYTPPPVASLLPLPPLVPVAVAVAGVVTVPAMVPAVLVARVDRQHSLAPRREQPS
jgi:hypothetical protein